MSRFLASTYIVFMVLILFFLLLGLISNNLAIFYMLFCISLCLIVIGNDLHIKK